MKTTARILLVLLTAPVVLAGCVQPEDFGTAATGGRAAAGASADAETGDADIETNPGGGDLSMDDADKAYTDSEPRFHERLNGTEDSVRTFDVQPRAGLGPIHAPLRLRIGALYTLRATARITLTDPDHREKMQLAFDGRKEADLKDWYVDDDPKCGEWTLSIHLRPAQNEAGAVGAYTFGVYLDS